MLGARRKRLAALAHAGTPNATAGLLVCDMRMNREPSSVSRHGTDALLYSFDINTVRQCVGPAQESIKRQVGSDQKLVVSRA